MMEPASLLLVSDVLRRRRSAPDFPGGPNNAIGGFQGGDSHARHAHTVCGWAPAMWCVQRKPHEQTEDVPDVYDDGSVVRQLLAESRLRWLADMPRKQK